ncbi:MAG: AI-2E family transporter [Proteobacteria bacterium]|nr:AI-2E family transporter [Pseudomonadota bacterium]NOG60132.1 AI-2E family transporter [Pseudomonadota bacterium]
MTDAQKWLILVGIIATGYLLYLLAPILTPFLLSAFLAYIGDPAVDRLENIKFSRTVSVIFVFFLMLVIALSFVLIVFPLIEEQIRRLLMRLPEMIDWIQSEFIPWITQRFGLQADSINLDGIKQSLTGHWQALGNIAGKFLTKISASGQLILLWVSYILLVPVVTFYLLRDWDVIVTKVRKLIPRRYEFVSVKLVKECDAVLSEFFRGQLLVMFAQGVIYSIGLWIVGLEFSLLIGMTAGLVSFVPYLGAIVGIVVATIAAFMQFHDIAHIVYVLIVFGIGQTLEGVVLSPLLIGDRIGLHPVAVIFSVMAGAQLFGFFGMLIALPAAAVIVVLLRHFHDQYLNSNFYTP